MVFGESGCNRSRGFFLLRLYSVNVCDMPCISSSLCFEGSAAGDGPACHTLGEILIRAYPPRWKAVFCFIVVSHLLESIDIGPFMYIQDFGLVLLGTLALWAAALLAIRQTALLPFIIGNANAEPLSNQHREGGSYSVGL